MSAQRDKVKAIDEMRKVVFEYLKDRKLDKFLDGFSDDLISDMYIEINKWREN